MNKEQIDRFLDKVLEESCLHLKCGYPRFDKSGKILQEDVDIINKVFNNHQKLTITHNILSNWHIFESIVNKYPNRIIEASSDTKKIKIFDRTLKNILIVKNLFKDEPKKEKKVFEVFHLTDIVNALDLAPNATEEENYSILDSFIKPDIGGGSPSLNFFNAMINGAKTENDYFKISKKYNVDLESLMPVLNQDDIHKLIYPFVINKNYKSLEHPPVYSDDIMRLLIAKKFNPTHIRKINSILNKYPASDLKFINSCSTMEELIDAYNKNKNIDVNIKNELNTKVLGRNLGAGEIVFVLMMKNAVSGGQSSGDMIINGKVIDIKQLTEGRTFKVSPTSINADKSLVIQELQNIRRFYHSNLEVMKQIITDFAVSLNSEGEDIKNTDSIEAAIIDVLSSILRNEIYISKFNLLKSFFSYVNSIKTVETKDAAKFYIDGEKHEVGVVGVDADEKEDIRKVDAKLTPKKDIDITITPLNQKEATINKLKKFNIVKDYNTLLNNTNFSNQLLALIHYDGLICISNDLSKAKYYGKKDFNSKNMLFNAFTFQKLDFKVITF